MAATKRKAHTSECEDFSKKKIKESIVSSTPFSVPGPSSFGSSLSSIECSSEISSSGVSNKSSGKSDVGPSGSEVFVSANESPELELPESVNVFKFAQCRASEIASLVHETERKRPKLTQQQLPYHMRRRAASHNANRVPRRLREKALREIQKAKKTKRPSRKHRRRPSNLLAEYNRRQREHIWLETHIWFAKRFKMTKLWGCQIPLHSNDKNVRASFRSSARHVLLQDLSYFCCIELKGPEQKLLQKLSQLTNVSTGPTFASKMCITGIREGCTFLYNSLVSPIRSMGPVSFLWQPYGNKDSRRLWIWCHPALHNELVDVLKIIFSLSDAEQPAPVTNPEADCTVQEENRKSELADQVANVEKNLNLSKEKKESTIYSDQKVSESICNVLDKKLGIRFKRVTQYANEDVSLTLLKNALVRHRLIGPLSQSVICDVLKPADVSCNMKPVMGLRKWWEKFYSSEAHHDAFKKQKSAWTQMLTCRTPDEVHPKMILGFTVKDPRLDLPKIKTKISGESEDLGTISGTFFRGNIPEFLSHSPLWEQNIRDEVTATKQPESELNKMRSQFLVPGSRLELGRDECRIPVIAIQQPGINGYSSGWDIIAPVGWSMPFWIAFIYRGARAAGLRDLRTISREAARPLFPCHFPDTSAGKEWEETHRKTMLMKHFRYPPAKRPSFHKLGVLTPFFMPWNTLVANWTKQLFSQSNYSPTSNDSDILNINSSSSFFVLRTKKELQQLKEACELLTKLSKQRLHKNNTYLTTVKTCLENFKSKMLDSNELSRALVCVSVKCLNKGNPSEFSGIYLPEDSDLLMFKHNHKFGGPSEPVHSVPSASANESKPKKCKKKKKNNTTFLSKVVCKSATQSPEEDSRLKRPVVENLIDHCSRQLMGLIEIGNYSYLNACGTGLGHCSLIAVLEMLRKCYQAKTGAMILVRSQSGFQYRLASIDVVTSVF